MKVILAVISDLYDFAVSAFLPKNKSAIESPIESFEAHLINAASRLPASTQSKQATSDPRILLETPGLVWAVTEASMYMNPSYEVDMKICVVPFGAELHAEDTASGWVKVQYNKYVGWVSMRTLTSTKEDIEPSFESGDSVRSDTSNTRLVRYSIKDEFGAASISTHLLDIEYVYFRLTRGGRAPNWPTDRPRLAGTWQHLLRGKRGVHMNVRPMTDSVIEFENPQGVKNSAYVTSVAPDQRIKIEGIYGEDKTIFQSEEFQQETWREWRPVFISIT